MGIISKKKIIISIKYIIKRNIKRALPICGRYNFKYSFIQVITNICTLGGKNSWACFQIQIDLFHTHLIYFCSHDYTFEKCFY